MFTWKTQKNEILDITDLFQDKIKYLHTSGHVGSDDLQKVIKVLQPKKVFPIHTENQKGVENIRGDAQVICLENGETYHLK
ncbi:MAG: MBL fold metallo-hydrolase RNA specificity domain-containing protein [Eubacteriales bacterium]